MTVVFWRCTAEDPHYGGGYLPDACPHCTHGRVCGAPCIETSEAGNPKRKRRAKVAA